MWPFKPKMSIGGVCGEYYNNNVLRPMVTTKKGGPLVWDAFLKNIENVDYAAAAADEELFRREFAALRVELFGLAWSHLQKEEDFLVREILFTRRYLNDMQRTEVWESMDDYNKTILRSSESMHARQGEREQVVTRLVNNGLDEEPARRVVNRAGSEDSWNEGLISGLMSDTFKDRIDCQLRSQGLQIVEASIKEIYKEAEKTIKSYKIQVSWDG